MAKKKKQNAFVRYFNPFGVKQVGDLSMLLGALLIFIGFFVFESTNVVMVIGISFFILGTAIAMYRTIPVLFSKINHRSPEYKHAIVNTIILAIMFVIAVLAMLAAFGVIGSAI